MSSDSYNKPYQIGKSLKVCPKYEVISDLKMITEILWGVPLLIKICTKPLPKYDNWNSSRGFPTNLFFPLGPTQFFVSNNSINFLCVFPLHEGGLVSTCPSLYSTIFEKLKVFSPKTNLSYQNCGIFHDSNVGLFWKHPGQCGTFWTMTEMGFRLCDSNQKLII